LNLLLFVAVCWSTYIRDQLLLFLYMSELMCNVLIYTADVNTCVTWKPEKSSAGCSYYLLVLCRCHNTQLNMRIM